ncbi:MAG: cytochrome c biogenesis protein CcdA, partial [Gemmatimonadaceae bacterium]
MELPVSFGLAFVAGLVSFLSPCVLPLVPSYVTFVTGMTLDDLSGTD